MGCHCNRTMASIEYPENWSFEGDQLDIELELPALACTRTCRTSSITLGLIARGFPDPKNLDVIARRCMHTFSPAARTSTSAIFSVRSSTVGLRIRCLCEGEHRACPPSQDATVTVQWHSLHTFAPFDSLASNSA